MTSPWLRLLPFGLAWFAAAGCSLGESGTATCDDGGVCEGADGGREDSSPSMDGGRDADSGGSDAHDGAVDSGGDATFEGGGADSGGGPETSTDGPADAPGDSMDAPADAPGDSTDAPADAPGDSTDAPADAVGEGDTGGATDAGEAGDAPGCPPGQTSCSGTCTDTTTDGANCGACGKACPTGSVCTGGTCALVCAPPTTACGASCKNTAIDPANCGACGDVCGPYANAEPGCDLGKCVYGCDPGFLDCASLSGCEVNGQTDVKNCGACNAVCGTTNATPACASGRCSLACNTGFADCNRKNADGCEVNLGTDNAHCGTCKNACATGFTCTNGVCLGLIGTGTLGDPFTSTPADTSCKQYLADYPTLAQSGYYTVSPSGSAFEVYCDQSDFGGGWTRCLAFTNTVADDLGSNDDWFDTCVDYSNTGWVGTDLMVELADSTPALLYSATGTRVGTWSYDQITSTTGPTNQWWTQPPVQDQLITLSTGDTLVVTGQNASGNGCWGSIGDGYGITLYPAVPAFGGNPEMFVMSYGLQVGFSGPRQFNELTPAIWSPSNEITWNGGSSFNACSDTPAGTLGTFSFFLR